MGQVSASRAVTVVVVVVIVVIVFVVIFVVISIAVVVSTRDLVVRSASLSIKNFFFSEGVKILGQMKKHRVGASLLLNGTKRLTI